MIYPHDSTQTLNLLLSGKHFEKKKKNGLDFGNEIQPFSFIFVLTKK